MGPLFSHRHSPSEASEPAPALRITGPRSVRSPSGGVRAVSQGWWLGRSSLVRLCAEKRPARSAPAKIGEWVGQRNLAVTANTYTHVLADETELDYTSLLAA